MTGSPAEQFDQQHQWDFTDLAALFSPSVGLKPRRGSLGA